MGSSPGNNHNNKSGLSRGRKPVNKRRSKTGATGQSRSVANGDTGGGVYGGIIRTADRVSKIAVTTLIAAAVIFGAYLAIASYSDNAVKNYPVRAGQYLADGEYKKAVDLYSKYLTKFPDNKMAIFGYIEAAITYDKPAARDGARALLESGTLIAADYPQFIELCERIGDRELNIDAYSEWLRCSPGHVGAMIELAKAYIEKGALDPALNIIKVMREAGHREAATVLLGRAVEKAVSVSTPPGEFIILCEMWYESDDTNLDALLALAGAYANGGMVIKSEESFRRALEMNIGSAAAYDGLLNLIYQNDRLRDRYDLLETAIRNVGGRKYRDMLDTTKIKLAEYYTIVREDGITYRDGIFRITRFDPYGNEIYTETPAYYSPDEISYLIEFYDDLGNAKEMFLDSARIQVQIADIDMDGMREILIKRYITAGGMSEEAMRNAVWYDVYRIDREINKLIYVTPEHAKYYGNTYARDLGVKLSRFERLSEAMEGHYGVLYGILYALRIAAIDFANGEWTPNGNGADLRARICQTLIVPDLEHYVMDKDAMFGFRYGDFRILPIGQALPSGQALPAGLGAVDEAGGIYPGVLETDVTNLLGPPRYVTEEEMKAVRPDGVRVTYTNRILEYAGLNIYTNDGVVKAIRVNSRDYDGPRALRIGDSVRDIINKFPSAYFNDTAEFPLRKADSDVEFMDPERGVVLNYVVKNGIIMSIELFIRDVGGDWKPGTNIETIVPPGAAPEIGVSADAGDGAGADAGGTAAGDGNGAPSASDTNTPAVDAATDETAPGADNTDAAPEDVAPVSDAVVPADAAAGVTAPADGVPDATGAALPADDAPEDDASGASLQAPGTAAAAAGVTAPADGVPDATGTVLPADAAPEDDASGIVAVG